MEFESTPIQIQFFKENVTHSYTNRSNFVPNFEQNQPIFTNFLSQSFRQILKNRPIQIPNFAFYKGSFIYPEADVTTQVGGISL